MAISHSHQPVVEQKAEAKEEIFSSEFKKMPGELGKTDGDDSADIVDILLMELNKIGLTINEEHFNYLIHIQDKNEIYPILHIIFQEFARWTEHKQVLQEIFDSIIKQISWYPYISFSLFWLYEKRMLLEGWELLVTYPQHARDITRVSQLDGLSLDLKLFLCSSLVNPDKHNSISKVIDTLFLLQDERLSQVTLREIYLLNKFYTTPNYPVFNFFKSGHKNKQISEETLLSENSLRPYR